MKIPRTVPVGDSIYKVKFVKQIDPVTIDRRRRPGNRRRMTVGFCDSVKKTIFIKTGLKPQRRFETFLHELCHAVECEYGFFLPETLFIGFEKPLAKVMSIQARQFGLTQLRSCA